MVKVDNLNKVNWGLEQLQSTPKNMQIIIKEGQEKRFEKFLRRPTRNCTDPQSFIKMSIQGIRFCKEGRWDLH